MRTYKTRNPRKSPLWQCVHRHHATFAAIYPDAYEHKHGPLRPVVTDVFGKFLDCGTLERGFARVRCDHCGNEYLDFHPHIHALVADGLLDSDGTFQLAPEISDSVLSELFRNRVFKELLTHKLISPELVSRMKTWKHSGFNVHSGRSVPPENRAEREQLCQYVLRNPFSVEKITLESPTDTIIYRSKLNPKINRNFEVFDPVDFLAVLSQHIPDKHFQMVRYCGISTSGAGLRSSPQLARPHLRIPRSRTLNSRSTPTRCHYVELHIMLSGVFVMARSQRMVLVTDGRRAMTNTLPLN